MKDYHVTANIDVTVNAHSAEEAAALAYSAIKSQAAEPSRILVWNDPQPYGSTGGNRYSSTAWTFTERPQEIKPTTNPAVPQAKAEPKTEDMPPAGRPWAGLKPTAEAALQG